MNSQTPTMPNTNLHTNAQEAIQAPHAEEYSQIDSKIDDEEGWDIVLGNPPYIRQQNIAQHDKKRLKEHYQVSSGGADIYVYFFELALRILAQKGVFSLITSNKWIKASYGKPLRAFLLQNSYIKCYVDFEESKVFESADVEVGIITATNFCGDKAPIIKYYKGHKALKTHFAPIPQSHLNVNQFRFETQDKSTDIFLKLQSLPLSFEHIAHIAKGSSSGNDDVFVFDLIKSLKDTMEVQNKFGKFVLEKKILMPFCYGEDIERLSCVEVKKYLLYPYDEENVVIKKEILSKEYPLAFAYLEQMQTLLMQRKLKITKDNFYKFSALRNAHTYKNNKIMIPDLLYQPRFGFDNIGLFHNAGIHNVILKNQYQGLEKLVLGILNTQVFWFFIKNQAVSLRGAIRLMPTYMNAFSFPKITASNQHIVDTIIALVDEILRLKANCAVLENEASEKSPSQTPSASKVCHSEPPLGGEESLNESLVTHRDSSVVSLPQNDKLTAFTKNPNSNSSPARGEELLFGFLVNAVSLSCLAGVETTEESLLATSDSFRDSSLRSE
ncbi:Eco57I restriction-modification methylase domain-containing protein [Helicobacter marmotae]|uniref:Eco57I restriction-modification methylase domain-containing protein n=1 Tax=Helicobacter marmotae TaxID=152490 RepID=UPI000CF10A8A|nr:Eco57I restriction-modification methylase domain-containing protein [Helicobacter marmotae]